MFYLIYFFDDISHSLRFTFKVNQVSLPLIGVDHELVEVGVVLDDGLRNHLDDVLFAVLQLVQLQIDSEHIFPDGVGTGFESTTHHVPAEEVGSREEGQPSLFSAISATSELFWRSLLLQRGPPPHLSELAGLLVTGLKRETRSKQRYSR